MYVISHVMDRVACATSGTVKKVPDASEVRINQCVLLLQM